MAQGFLRPVAASCAVAMTCFCTVAVADDLVTLSGKQAAIVFLVDGQGRSGEMQVRDRQGQTAVWGSVLVPASMLQFTVSPGAYNVQLAPRQQAIAVSAVAGHATVISLTGADVDGAYRWQSQSEVAPVDIEQTAMPDFILEKRIPPAGYAPTSLDGQGTGLTFVFRTDL
jgi:hypothetical protein